MPLLLSSDGGSGGGGVGGGGGLRGGGGGGDDEQEGSGEESAGAWRKLLKMEGKDPSSLPADLVASLQACFPLVSCLLDPGERDFVESMTS